MNRFSPESEDKLSPATNASSNDSNDLSTIFHYPSLGQLFDTPKSNALAEMRARLGRTHEALERVIRQGAPDDAARASRVSRAYAVTLELLDNLEQVQQEIAKNRS